MKLVAFVKNKGKVKWSLFFENIKLNLEKGNAVFIGTDKQMKELKELFAKDEVSEK